MRFLNSLISFLSILFNLYVFVRVYSIMSFKKIKIKPFHICLILLLAMIQFVSVNIILDSYLKFIISFSIVFVLFYFYFKEPLREILFKTIIVYLVLFVCDFIIFGIFLFIDINSNLFLDYMSLIRALSTFLISISMLLIFLFKPSRKLVNKLLNYFTKKINNLMLFLSILTFAVFYFLTHLNAGILNIEVFLFSILLMIILVLFCIIMIYQYFKNKKNEEEQTTLLSLMKEYEILLDKDKINRHEMLNNLIIIKSFKKKNTKEFEDTLDEIISEYQENKSKLYSNLYKLPPGLKGIIYYKLNEIKNNNINMELLISTIEEERFNNLDSKIYYNVCKILGIILDNAIEASKETKDKRLLIDVYNEEDSLIIYIENDYINKVELNNIYKKGFSTKGKNRGYGLYVVNKIVSKCDCLEFNQYTNDKKFMTILKIKNPN